MIRAILENATLVIHVTVVGKMKKTFIITVCILIAICLVFAVFRLQENTVALAFFGVLFSAATSLFTCFAVLVAYKALKEDKQNFITKIRLGVFSDSMRWVVNEKKFQESQEYILDSRKFREDINTVRHRLNLAEGEDVSLDDFKKVFNQHLTVAGGIRNDKEEKNEEERLHKAYKKIRYFCSRMEYLGVISEEKDVDALILRYYGRTITDSYEKLERLILKTREQQIDKRLYTHYSNLYELAKGNKE